MSDLEDQIDLQFVDFHNFNALSFTMKNFILIFTLLFSANLISQNSSPVCLTAAPLINGANTYPSSTNNTAEAGPNYGCLASQPNPAWFYFKVDSAGSVIIDIFQLNQSGTGVDVDFICWGPFASAVSPCTAQLDSSKIIDCSYSTAYTEIVNVPSANAGDYYILLATNFSNQAGSVSITFNTSGTAAISSSESCVTHASYASPLCINGTLQLSSTFHLGTGNYFWTGPNGFSDTIQNPTVGGVLPINNGYYYVNYLRDSTCNYSDSVYVHADTCGLLTGVIYGDENSNCSADTNEIGIGNVKVKLSQNGNLINYAWTDPFGYYYFNVSPGTYTVEVVSASTNPITCPGSLAHATTITPLTITTENFAIDCYAPDFVASQLMVSGLAFFPGQTNYMHPCVHYQGPHCNTIAIPGYVKLVLDPLVNYISPFSGAITPVLSPAATGDTLTWIVADITALTYYYYGQYSFLYSTSSTATTNDTVHFQLMVFPFQNDVDTTNNVFLRDFRVGNSYDPNMKEVVPAGVGSQGYIPASTSELDYTIHFQNTGTAPAINIVVLDTLSTKVDAASVKIISSSHLQTTSLLPGNVLKFNFSNIYLADSLSNEPASHGYVKFTVQPINGLNPGDEIKNTADIYFDFNPPIRTNTALNTIEILTSVTKQELIDAVISPNPSNGLCEISFQSASKAIQWIRVSNIQGERIYHENLVSPTDNFNKKIDLSEYTSGMYMIQVGTTTSVHTYKLIKL